MARLDLRNGTRGEESSVGRACRNAHWNDRRRNGGALRVADRCGIVAGTTDGCAAFLASGASEPGDGVTSLGTTLTLKLLSATPVFAPQFGIYSHRIGDQWLAGGASNTGGAAIAKYFSREEIARLTPLLDPDHPTGLDFYPLASPASAFR